MWYDMIWLILLRLNTSQPWVYRIHKCFRGRPYKSLSQKDKDLLARLIPNYNIKLNLFKDHIINIFSNINILVTYKYLLQPKYLL
jgi:hypothetical protein